MVVRTYGSVFAVAMLLMPREAAAEPAPIPNPSASPEAAASDPCAALSSLVSRPTFSTAACAVKRGDLLLENGYTNLVSSGAGASALVTFPQTNMRVGLGRNVEFDLNPPSLGYLSGAPRRVGITDGALGFKYEIGYSSRLLYGINALYTLPVGSPDVFSSNGDGILVNLNGALTLSPAIGLSATVGYNAQNGGTLAAPARYHDFQPSLGASVSLPQSISVFAEAFDQSATAPGLGGRFGYDTGFEKDVGSRLQLDFNYFDYFAVQNGQHQHSLGFGASYLIGP
ncbi:MAG: transporter [Candidatus Eremiobacteraeota bacterium]|nr:transporter [Candidatus Eremiobacteraeota bacterium]